jgi:tryptophan-rich sensory protein
VRFPHARPLIALGICILGTELVGASGGVFTAQGLGVWYESLQQPAIAPAGSVIGAVWTVLFVIIGSAVWLVWRQARESPRAVRVAALVFAVHFLFNLGWSATFFAMQEIGWALVVIGALWVAILATMWAIDRVDRRAALLLVPYLLWVTFAAYLNYRFWVLN